MKFRAWFWREYYRSYYFSLLLGIIWLEFAVQDYLRGSYFFAAWQTFFAGWQSAWWLKTWFDRPRDTMLKIIDIYIKSTAAFIDALAKHRYLEG